jgi:YVTN family beta-propeller protein
MTLRQVGNYRLDSLLGRGGMGEVYKAYDTHRDRYVALKLLLGAYSGDQEYLQRFRRESYVAARLRDPHVIPIHDFGEIDGQLFIDMRLVDGADIGTLLDRDRRIAPERAVHLISQVAEALDAAHADHLVHRDIKPSNILVTSTDFVYVVDFGIARAVGGRQTPLTHTGAYIGTWDYMAPERFAGQDIDGRADVYSLACLLHECLTGAPPFGNRELYALMYAQLHFDPPEASRLVEGVPPALDAVIARGMAKDPKDRFQTAGALGAAAREALRAKAPAPQMPELQHTWTEIPDPTLQATAAAASQSVTEPPGPKPATQPLGPGSESAGDRAAPRVIYTPTQTATPDGADDGGYTPPPQDMRQGTGLDPDGNGLPPGVATGRAARGPARRRLGVLILAAAAALAVAIVLVVLASPGTKEPGSATGAGIAGTPSSVPRLAPPTLAGTAPVEGNPSYVQVAPNGKFAYITNPDKSVIDVLDTATDKVSQIISIPQGPPQAVSFSSDSQTAYVSVYSTSGKSQPLIAIVDTATGTVTSTVPVNNHEPGPSVASPDGPYLYVPNHEMNQGGTGDNVLDVIDLKTGKVQGVPVLANPHWVVVDKKTGQIYVTNHMSARVTVLNSSTNAIITTIQVGETPHSAALSPDGSRLAVTSYNGDTVFLINTATDQMIGQIPVGREPLDITYSPDGRYLFTANNLDNTVTVIDTADYRVIDEIPTGKGPTSISVLPNGRQAYVTDENSGTIEILNLPQ